MNVVTIDNLNTGFQASLSLAYSESPRAHMSCSGDGFFLTLLGSTAYQCIKQLNEILYSSGWALLCAGARIDAHCSGLLADSLGGSSVYVGPIGRDSEIQSIYAAAPIDKIIVPGQLTTMAAHLMNQNFRAIAQDKSSDHWIENYLAFRRSNIFLSPSNLRDHLFNQGLNSSEIACKFRGCLLGLAIGDALGTTLEFYPRDKKLITDMVGGGPFNLAPGQWTDDTSMTLCAAESLIESEGFDPENHMANFMRWRDEGHNSVLGYCFDIGRTTNLAISAYKNCGLYFAGIDKPNQAGNGALMRLAPDVLLYYKNSELSYKVAELSCRITHGSIEAIDACRYFSVLLVAAINGVDKETLLGDKYEPKPNFWRNKSLCNSIEIIAEGSYKRKTREEIFSTGYVVHTLEAVLWAFYHTDNFSDGALLAANLAGDSDTICSIYGQLAGAYYGEYSLPIDWINKLSKSNMFYKVADKLLALATSQQAELLA